MTPIGASRNNCAGPRTPRTSAASCTTSGLAISRRAPPRPKAASSASGAPCRIASPANSACATSPPRRPPTPFCPSSWRDFNARFTRTPAEAAPAWRRAPRDLALVLSCRYTRRVARDNTVHLGPRWLQLPPGPHQRSYARCRVELRELLDGRLVVLHEGAVLATQPAPPDFSLTPHSAPSSDRRHPAQRPGPAPAPLSRERAAPHTAQDQRGSPRAQALPLPQHRDRHAPRRATRGARPLPKRPRPSTPYRDDIFMLQLPRHFHVAATHKRG